MTEKDFTEQMLGMDEQEAELAEKFYAGIQAMSAHSDRSKQSAEFKIGVSDLGHCSELVRRMLLGITPDDETDLLAAWLGTAIGKEAEEAASLVWPDAIRQASVVVPFEIELPPPAGVAGEVRVFKVPGHPDLILPSEGILLDNKTSFGLQVAERVGPSRQQRFQRHSYALGSHVAGLFGDRPLDEIRVGNVWIDRSGVTKRVHVDLEPYDPEVVRECGEWLGEVVYAYLMTVDGHETVARKEPPREMCAVSCGYFTSCRGLDTDVEGLLTSQEVLAAVDMYLEGKAAAKAGEQLAKEAKVALEGISGSTGQHTVRWTWVNEVEVPSSRRRGYYRLALTPIRKPKKS